MKTVITIVEAQKSVQNDAVLSKNVLNAFHLTPNDTLEVQTRKGKGKFKTVGTFLAGKTYNGLNGIAAAYVTAERTPNVTRVLVPKIDRVLVKFAK